MLVTVENNTSQKVWQFHISAAGCDCCSVTAIWFLLTSFKLHTTTRKIDRNHTSVFIYHWAWGINLVGDHIYTNCSHSWKQAENEYQTSEPSKSLFNKLLIISQNSFRHLMPQSIFSSIPNISVHIHMRGQQAGQGSCCDSSQKRWLTASRQMRDETRQQQSHMFYSTRGTKDTLW